MLVDSIAQALKGAEDLAFTALATLPIRDPPASRDEGALLGLGLAERGDLARLGGGSGPASTQSYPQLL